MLVLNMGTKEKLLALLEASQGTYLSGEELAETLAVSRTSVWKAANALRNAGYAISGAQNRGYCLDARTDVLSEQGIRALLGPKEETLTLEVLSSAESTNALLREKANAGAPEGYVIAANAQTRGRGRLGRSFFSPPDTGIYMSLLLRPRNLSAGQAVRVTTMAAVAAAEAIESVSGRETKIKWVNDIFIGRKKVSGILTEASFDLESGSVDYIVLGIGMNAYEPAGGFPPEIREVAGSIFSEQRSNGKNRLTAEFLTRFLELYQNETNDYTEIYRRRSLVIGKRVQVITPTSRRLAYALDIDGTCRLVVRYEDGTVDQLSSSEVSVLPD